MNISKWVFSPVASEWCSNNRPVCGLVYPHKGFLGYPLLRLHSLGARLVTQRSWPPNSPPPTFNTWFIYSRPPSPPFKSNPYLKFTFQICWIHPYFINLQTHFACRSNTFFNANEVSYIPSHNWHMQAVIHSLTYVHRVRKHT